MCGGADVRGVDRQSSAVARSARWYANRSCRARERYASFDRGWAGGDGDLPGRAWLCLAELLSLEGRAPPAVPTWNYQVVHAYGRITFQHDEHAKRAAVGLLTRTHERRLNGKDAWRMADAPEDYMQQMLGNIVAFRLKVERLLAKSKLSQNREERDFAGAISGLKASGNEALAEMMEKRRPKAE